MNRKSVIGNHIFIIEDDMCMQYILKYSFSKICTTTTFSNARAALYAIESGVIPDLIITDLNTPLMNGLELLSQLKTNSEFNDIPVIVVSADHSSDKRIKSISAGADDYVLKAVQSERTGNESWYRIEPGGQCVFAIARIKWKTKRIQNHPNITIMNFLNECIYYATILLFLFLCLQSCYLFLFALAGRLLSLKTHKHSNQLGRFVVYLFCSREEEITESVQAILSLNYPADKRHIIVITPSLHTAAALALQELPVQVIEISNYHTSKAEALQAAFQQTKNQFDYALMLDAQHICTKGFLYRMNDALQNDCPVVQAQRVVRYNGTSYALLDAISEGVDTHIFCKSHRLLGLSSAIAGSGLAIRFSLFEDVVPQLTGTGDFDREIELHLLRKQIHFGYVPKALLYEEKKTHHSGSEQKWHRWLASQSQTLHTYLSDGYPQLSKGNIDFLDKIFQNLLLPRILMLGITPLAVLLSLLQGPALSTNYWIFLWILTYTAILMSIPAKYVTNQFLKSVFLLPSLFLRITRLFLMPKPDNTKLMRVPYNDIHA